MPSTGHHTEAQLLGTGQVVIHSQVFPLNNAHSQGSRRGEERVRGDVADIQVRGTMPCIRLVVLGILGSGARNLGIGSIAVATACGRIEWNCAAFFQHSAFCFDGIVVMFLGRFALPPLRTVTCVYDWSEGSGLASGIASESTARAPGASLRAVRQKHGYNARNLQHYRLTHSFMVNVVRESDRRKRKHEDFSSCDECERGWELEMMRPLCQECI